MTLNDFDGIVAGIEKSVVEHYSKVKSLTPEERLILIEAEKVRIFKKLKQWIVFGQYITLSFDCETMKAKVEENEER